MNCFEQLSHLGSEAPHVFENIAGLLVAQKYQQAHRTRLSQGDSGVDVWRWDENGDSQHIFQVKFYVGKLTKKQKTEIEASFNTANSSPVVSMKKWTLCLPGRLSIEDSHWFVEFRKKIADVKIELLDGDALIEILRSPGAAHARRELVSRGMTGIPDGGPTVQPVLHIIIEDAQRNGYDAVSIIMVKNSGDRSVRDMKLHVKFSSNTGYPAIWPSETRWHRVRSGILDCPSDFEIHARHAFHAGETFEVVQIPIRPRNFDFAVDVFGENMEPTFWRLTASAETFQRNGRIEFEKQPGSARPSISRPEAPVLSETAANLATEMLSIDDPAHRGISRILVGVPGRDLEVPYYPGTTKGYKGVGFMEKQRFISALTELIQLGFLKQVQYSTDRRVGFYVFRAESESRLRTLLA